ncbi:MAG: class I SAM-dependent methyltransferase [Ignavibacteriaceae bacterium]|nr:class I SAM-dependent methyltransferase [Ignavibacteriaceae bacterium]
MNEIVYWNFDKSHLKNSAIQMRETAAINYELKLLSDNKKFKAMNNDYCVDAIKMAERIIGTKISGTVVEVGAGSGVYSCSVAKNSGIEKIYAVEYSEKTVKELMTFVIKKNNFVPEIENKIFPTVGSFDEIKLPDNSVDFIIDVGSLHHSEDRERTFKELYRVLKIGGFLIGIDRCSYNTKTNADLQNKLDRVYSKTYKLDRGYNTEEKLTRRMNSEHDPLLAEWEYLLIKVGFKLTLFWIYSFGTDKKLLRILYKFTVGIFFKIFGGFLMYRKITQLGNMKIPFYPFFSKNQQMMNMIIIAEKKEYIAMP